MTATEKQLTLKIKSTRYNLFNAYQGTRLVESADSASSLVYRLMAKGITIKPIFTGADCYVKDVSANWDEYAKLG